MPQFTLTVDDQPRTLSVSSNLLTEGESFFAKLDADMAQGWQMGRTWIAQPDLHQRCQIVAHRLMTALEASNEHFASLLIAYLLSRLPQLTQIEVDTQGEIQDIRIELCEVHPGLMPAPTARPAAALSKMDALNQASREISRVYRVGKSYRYARYDHETQIWRESDAYSSQPEAEKGRMEAYRNCFESLLQPH